MGAACLGGCGASFNNSLGSGTSAGGATSFAPTSAAEAANAGALAQAVDKFTAVATPGNSAYRIGPMDALDVTVFKVPDLSRSVQVGDDGIINYPLVGDIPASGKTAHELERELTQKLAAKYLRSPQVTVVVKDYNSQRVTVDGSVKTTGVYNLKGRTTLVQVLAMAGGVDAATASGNVVIFRTIDGKRSAAKFDVDAIKEGKAEDPDLQPGDVIVVDTSGTKVALQNVLRVLPLMTTTAAFVPLL